MKDESTMSIDVPTIDDKETPRRKVVRKMKKKAGLHRNLGKSMDPGLSGLFLSPRGQKQERLTRLLELSNEPNMGLSDKTILRSFRSNHKYTGGLESVKYARTNLIETEPERPVG